MTVADLLAKFQARHSEIAHNWRQISLISSMKTHELCLVIVPQAFERLFMSSSLGSLNIVLNLHGSQTKQNAASVELPQPFSLSGVVA